MTQATCEDNTTNLERRMVAQLQERAAGASGRPIRGQEDPLVLYLREFVAEDIQRLIDVLDWIDCYMLAELEDDGWEDDGDNEEKLQPARLRGG